MSPQTNLDRFLTPKSATGGGQRGNNTQNRNNGSSRKDPPEFLTEGYREFCTHVETLDLEYKLDVEDLRDIFKRAKYDPQGAINLFTDEYCTDGHRKRNPSANQDPAPNAKRVRVTPVSTNNTITPSTSGSRQSRVLDFNSPTNIPHVAVDDEVPSAAPVAPAAIAAAPESGRAKTPLSSDVGASTDGGKPPAQAASAYRRICDISVSYQNDRNGYIPNQFSTYSQNGGHYATDYGGIQVPISDGTIHPFSSGDTKNMFDYGGKKFEDYEDSALSRALLTSAFETANTFYDNSVDAPNCQHHNCLNPATSCLESDGVPSGHPGDMRIVYTPSHCRTHATGPGHWIHRLCRNRDGECEEGRTLCAECMKKEPCTNCYEERGHARSSALCTECLKKERCRNCEEERGHARDSALCTECMKKERCRICNEEKGHTHSIALCGECMKKELCSECEKEKGHSLNFALCTECLKKEPCSNCKKEKGHARESALCAKCMKKERCSKCKKEKGNSRGYALCAKCMKKILCSKCGKERGHSRNFAICNDCITKKQCSGCGKEKGHSKCFSLCQECWRKKTPCKVCQQFNCHSFQYGPFCTECYKKQKCSTKGCGEVRGRLHSYCLRCFQKKKG